MCDISDHSYLQIAACHPRPRENLMRLAQFCQGSVELEGTLLNNGSEQPTVESNKFASN